MKYKIAWSQTNMDCASKALSDPEYLLFNSYNILNPSTHGDIFMIIFSSANFQVW